MAAKVLKKADLTEKKGKDISIEDIPVPEEGEEAVVRVREMPSEAYEEFERWWWENSDSRKSARNQNPPKGYRWLLLRLTVVDENNEPLFESEQEAQETLGPLNGNMTQRVLSKALELNGLTEEAVEQERKNSSSTRG